MTWTSSSRSRLPTSDGYVVHGECVLTDDFMLFQVGATCIIDAKCELFYTNALATHHDVMHSAMERLGRKTWMWMSAILI
jgi:hypothetical protein